MITSSIVDDCGIPKRIMQKVLKVHNTSFKIQKVFHERPHCGSTTRHTTHQHTKKADVSSLDSMTFGYLDTGYLEIQQRNVVTNSKSLSHSKYEEKPLFPV